MARILARIASLAFARPAAETMTARSDAPALNDSMGMKARAYSFPVFRSVA